MDEDTLAKVVAGAMAMTYRDIADDALKSNLGDPRWFDFARNLQKRAEAIEANLGDIEKPWLSN